MTDRLVPTWLRGLTALISLAAGLALSVSPASAAVECGDVITTDIELERNLDCSGLGTDGLQVGGDGVTIDLNGKKLIGDVNHRAIDADLHEGLVVKDGSLQGWRVGVDGSYASRARIANLDIRLGGDNVGWGVRLRSAIDEEIKNVDVYNARYGFHFEGLVGFRLTNSRVRGSDDGETYGVHASHRNRGVIDDLTANGALYGVSSEGGTMGFTVRDSAFNNAGSAGVQLSFDGRPPQHQYTLRDNVAHNAERYGFYATEIVDGDGNKATGAGRENCFNVRCED